MLRPQHRSFTITRAPHLASLVPISPCNTYILPLQSISLSIFPNHPASLLCIS